jgi:PhzF family phenazine biosynthesis protein
MRLPIFQLDAFTSRLFAGNPAAVVILEEWLPDDVLQAIARENNLSETAFVIPRNEYFDLRWLTPEVEVDLCGHATLASAQVIFQHGYTSRERIVFQSRSGMLKVERKGGLLTMDFPARPPRPIDSDAAVTGALGAEPGELHASRDLLAVFDSQAQVEALEPDFAALARLDAFAVIVTAPGDSCDFVSRFFAPRAGIPEDPVTGSAHCTLVPYWSARLGKPVLHARQVSSRGGELYCEHRGDRVMIAGQVVEYLSGEIDVQGLSTRRGPT